MTTFSHDSSAQDRCHVVVPEFVSVLIKQFTLKYMNSS